MRRLRHIVPLALLSCTLFASACSGDDLDNGPVDGVPVISADPNADAVIQYLPLSEIVAAQQQATEVLLANTWTSAGASAVPAKTGGGKNILALDGFESGDALLSPVSGVVRDITTSDAAVAGYSVLAVVMDAGEGVVIGFEANAATGVAPGVGDAVRVGEPLLRMTGEYIPEGDSLSLPAQVAVFDITTGGDRLPGILARGGVQLAVAQ